MEYGCYGGVPEFLGEGEALGEPVVIVVVDLSARQEPRSPSLRKSCIPRIDLLQLLRFECSVTVG